MMKKQTKLFIALFTGMLVLTACSDFLNEEPISTWGLDTFYTSPLEADIALSGIYSVLASDNIYGSGLSMAMESGTDEGYYNRRWDEGWSVGLYRHTPSDKFVKNLWTDLYKAINLCNMFIEKLDSDAFDDTEYEQYIAEAKFLRAHAYSILVNWYEEVPMVLTYTVDQKSNDIAPSSLPALYKQIIGDFTYATEHLLETIDANYIPGRANKMAAHGLLARVYLKMAGYPLKDTSKYTDAKEQCDIIIQSGNHSISPSIMDPTDPNVALTDEYRKHFMHYITNRYDLNESLFEISFRDLRESGITASGRIGGLNGLSFSFGGLDDGYPNAYAYVNASPLLLDSYDANGENIRKAWNLPGMAYTSSGNAVRVSNTLATQYCPGKYRRWEPADYDDLDKTPEPGVFEPYILLEANPVPNRNFTTVNMPVLRYADILLMYAEADNAINGPTAISKGYFNQVRARAGLDPINDILVNTNEKFFEQITEERFREFCFEGLRKMDLIRWEMLGERLDLLHENIINSPNYSSGNAQANSYLRSSNFFDESKHLSLPYPLQEVNINSLLDQKPNW
jgi:hypothetical protein